MANPTYTHIFHISGPEETTSQFQIPIGITIISRQEGVGLHLDSKFISRRHARLECIDTECHLTDLGSENGSYINGERLEAQTPYLLQHNDQIKIGPFTLVVEKIALAAVEEVAETPAPPPEPVAAEELPGVAVAETPPPPPPPSEPPTAEAQPPEKDAFLPPPGLGLKSTRLINYLPGIYLPGIYQSDLLARFLGIFEAILTPIEWNIDNFDLYLSPKTCPSTFLPWLATWFEIEFDETWSEAKRRQFLQEAHQIYAGRGTPRALRRTLEIYTGLTPTIDDTSNDLEPHTFRVFLPVPEKDVQRTTIEALINAHKPAHTAYELHFQE